MDLRQPLQLFWGELEILVAEMNGADELVMEVTIMPAQAEGLPILRRGYESPTTPAPM